MGISRSTPERNSGLDGSKECVLRLCCRLRGCGGGSGSLIRHIMAPTEADLLGGRGTAGSSSSSGVSWGDSEGARRIFLTTGPSSSNSVD